GDVERAGAFFRMCQGIDGCEYLSRVPDSQAPYELRPTMRNVATAAASLLGLKHRGQRVKSMRELQSAWNCHVRTRPELTLLLREGEVGLGIGGEGGEEGIEEGERERPRQRERTYAGEREMTREAEREGGREGEEMREGLGMRKGEGGGREGVGGEMEVAALHLRGGEVTLHVHLLDDLTHHVAILHSSTHHLSTFLASARRAHLQVWADGPPVAGPLWSLHSLLLSDEMILALPPHAALQQRLHAIFSTRWGRDVRVWAPLTEESNIAAIPGEVVAVDKAAEAAARRSLAAVAAIFSSCEPPPHPALSPSSSLSSVRSASIATAHDKAHLFDLLAEILQSAPSISARRLADAVLLVSPQTIEDALGCESVVRAMASRADGPLLLAMLRHCALAQPLGESIKQLGPGDVVLLTWFAANRAVWTHYKDLLTGVSRSKGSGLSYRS
ncbi:MAG: hypothetical protein SGPRY_014577, partial [Prymnesium sp.]